ncbi:hypothetical protein J437_LFUL000454 [Ladona fulva]|uniref:Uncharacterized protein n=1 Tax=Ladona fulva TaxID=123851 RepID=A0A8K0K538_LADFU|nr:hypothetical protein J437_LFUL000454 [Ladona fulva]
MSTSAAQFSHHEFASPRKRYNFAMLDEEDDSCDSPTESLRGDEIPLLSSSSHTSSFVTPLEVLYRLFFSLFPPFRPAKVLAKLPVDPIGPVLVVTFLISFLIYASSKTPPFEYRVFGPVIIILSYLVLSSLFVFCLGKLISLDDFHINFLQTVALIGYSLFGHLLILCISYTLYEYPEPAKSISSESRMAGENPLIHDASFLSSVEYEDGSISPDSEPNWWGDKAFLFCLALIAGPSALRISLILLSPIQSPPGRMVLGTILCLSHLLLLIVLHTSFLHPTFKYGANGS